MFWKRPSLLNLQVSQLWTTIPCRLYKNNIILNSIKDFPPSFVWCIKIIVFLDVKQGLFSVMIYLIRYCNFSSCYWLSKYNFKIHKRPISLHSALLQLVGKLTRYRDSSGWRAALLFIPFNNTLARSSTIFYTNVSDFLWLLEWKSSDSLWLLQ